MRSLALAAVLTGAAVWTSAALVHGANDDNPWPQFAKPAPGPARSIGSYSAGCLQGAEVLPFDGVGYQVMRPSRRRNYGHPNLVAHVQTLARRMNKLQLAPLLVGDLAQARGGRASSGHASHQTGLDVDVWYTSSPKKLTLEQRETYAAGDIVNIKLQRMVPSSVKRVERVLRLVVEDEHVDRVFVNPVIKKQLCERSGEQREWLRKVRPWYGHSDHFHVRLACAAADVDCERQAPLGEGDGCDKLGSWLKPKRKGNVTGAAPNPNPSAVAGKPVRPAAPSPQLVEYRRSVAEGNGWPDGCNALLNAK